MHDVPSVTIENGSHCWDIPASGELLQCNPGVNPGETGVYRQINSFPKPVGANWVPINQSGSIIYGKKGATSQHPTATFANRTTSDVTTAQIILIVGHSFLVNDSQKHWILTKSPSHLGTGLSLGMTHLQGGTRNT